MWRLRWGWRAPRPELSHSYHTYRWVEFQNKFFYGDGQKYNPFDFEKLKKSAEEE